MDFIQWVTERTPDPGWAFFWVYRTHRNIKSSGSSKIHWIWYLAFSKIWQNMDIYHPVDKFQWIKSSGWNPFFCPSSGLGRSTGCLPNALYICLRYPLQMFLPEIQRNSSLSTIIQWSVHHRICSGTLQIQFLFLVDKSVAVCDYMCSCNFRRQQNFFSK